MYLSWREGEWPLNLTINSKYGFIYLFWFGLQLGTWNWRPMIHGHYIRRFWKGWLKQVCGIFQQNVNS